MKCLFFLAQTKIMVTDFVPAFLFLLLLQIERVETYLKVYVLQFSVKNPQLLYFFFFVLYICFSLLRLPQLRQFSLGLRI